jgi:hypothetical protein
MKKSTILFLILLISAVCKGQDNSFLVSQLNLPEPYKSYLKAYSFLELYKKSSKYKKLGREEEFEFLGFSNWRTQECAFNEITLTSENDEYGVKIPTLAKKIKFYFKNQKLLRKEITSYYKGEHQSSIDVYFHSNGRVKQIFDSEFKRNWFFDENGVNVEKNNEKSKESEIIKSGLGYDLPRIEIKNIQFNSEKMQEIKDMINKIQANANFNKSYDDFTVDDWQKFNKIRDYLNKELSINVFEGKDLFFRSFNRIFLDLIYEDGSFYTIEDYPKNDKQERKLTQFIHDPEETFVTKIGHYPNGTVKSICQYEIKDSSRMMGINSNYAPDGSLVKEINIENEFKLDLVKVFSILRSTAQENGEIKYSKENAYRYLDTNYGNVWEINFYRNWYQEKIFINDATGKIYDHLFKVFSAEEYQSMYGIKDYREIEAQINSKILIVRTINCF